VTILNGSGEGKKVGILGGTFDPVHNAHMAIIDEARLELELEEIILVPAGIPWMKSNRTITVAEHRVRMLRLAIADRYGFYISTAEIDRPGPSYTVDTLEEFNKEYQGLADLFFLLGWDNLPELPRWKNPERIIELCTLVAFPRPGTSPPDIVAVDQIIPGLSKHIICMEKPNLDIRATEIRERTAKGMDITHLVPAPVAEYIKQNRLYSK
jgi:nicotinate-nucleotide adenylyltransferase